MEKKSQGSIASNQATTKHQGHTDRAGQAGASREGKSWRERKRVGE
jgi:hypothetical protein